MKDQLVKHKVFIALAHLGFWPHFSATCLDLLFKEFLMWGEFGILSCG